MFITLAGRRARTNVQRLSVTSACRAEGVENIYPVRSDLCLPRPLSSTIVENIDPVLFCLSVTSCLPAPRGRFYSATQHTWLQTKWGQH